MLYGYLWFRIFALWLISIKHLFCLHLGTEKKVFFWSSCFDNANSNNFPLKLAFYWETLKFSISFFFCVTASSSCNSKTKFLNELLICISNHDILWLMFTWDSHFYHKEGQRYVLLWAADVYLWKQRIFTNLYWQCLNRGWVQS